MIARAACYCDVYASSALTAHEFVMDLQAMFLQQLHATGGRWLSLFTASDLGGKVSVWTLLRPLPRSGPRLNEPGRINPLYYQHGLVLCEWFTHF